MAQRRTSPRRPTNGGPPRDGVALRRLASGSIEAVGIADGEGLAAGDATTVVFVRLAGRGRILWPGGEEDGRDPRGLGLFLVPPAAELRVAGAVRGLRVALPGLPTSGTARPLADMLAGLVCRRAWHAPDPTAEAALALVRLLVAETGGENGDRIGDWGDPYGG